MKRNNTLMRKNGWVGWVGYDYHYGSESIGNKSIYEPTLETTAISTTLKLSDDDMHQYRHFRSTALICVDVKLDAGILEPVAVALPKDTGLLGLDGEVLPINSMLLNALNQFGDADTFLRGKQLFSEFSKVGDMVFKCRDCEIRRYLEKHMIILRDHAELIAFLLAEFNSYFHFNSNMREIVLFENRTRRDPFPVSKDQNHCEKRLREAISEVSDHVEAVMYVVGYGISGQFAILKDVVENNFRNDFEITLEGMDGKSVVVNRKKLITRILNDHTFKIIIGDKEFHGSKLIAAARSKRILDKILENQDCNEFRAVVMFDDDAQASKAVSLIADIILGRERVRCTRAVFSNERRVVTELMHAFKCDLWERVVDMFEEDRNELNMCIEDAELYSGVMEHFLNVENDSVGFVCGTLKDIMQPDTAEEILAILRRIAPTRPNRMGNMLRVLQECYRDRVIEFERYSTYSGPLDIPVITILENDDDDKLSVMLSGDELEESTVTLSFCSSQYDINNFCSPVATEIPLLGAAALLGAVKCFKLLLNREEDDVECLQSCVCYALAGGNTEIIHIFMDKVDMELLYEGVKWTVIYHHYDIFDWLMENREESPAQYEIDEILLAAGVMSNFHVITYAIEKNWVSCMDPIRFALHADQTAALRYLLQLEVRVFSSVDILLDVIYIGNSERFQFLWNLFGSYVPEHAKPELIRESIRTKSPEVVDIVWNCIDGDSLMIYGNSCSIANLYESALHNCLVHEIWDRFQLYERAMPTPITDVLRRAVIDEDLDLVLFIQQRHPDLYKHIVKSPITKCKCYAIMECLLQMGANPNYVDAKGRTALSEQSDPQIIALLQRYGAVR